MKITRASKIAILGILGAGIAAYIIATHFSAKYPLRIQRILDWSKSHGGCVVHMVQSYSNKTSFLPFENNWNESILENVWKSLTENTETKSDNEKNCKEANGGILRLSNEKGDGKWKKDSHTDWDKTNAQK